MLTELESRHLHAGHLPVVRGCIDRRGIQAVLERYLPTNSQSQATDAECALAMILNILSGRLALWRMDVHLAGMDVEVLLGEGVEAAWLHDTRLGKDLDRIHAAGTDTLLSGIVVGYLNSAEPSPFSIHLDTTALSLFGAHDGAPEPIPAHGFSKDHRPDLKQLVFGLSIHGSLAANPPEASRSGQGDPVVDGAQRVDRRQAAATSKSCGGGGRRVGSHSCAVVGDSLR